jgi:hypothetical protein
LEAHGLRRDIQRTIRTSFDGMRRMKIGEQETGSS